MKMIGPEAVAAYLKLCPNDTLDDLSEQDLAEFEFNDEPIRLRKLAIQWDRTLVAAGMAPSRAQARRLIQQNAVTIDTIKLTSPVMTEIFQPETTQAAFDVRVGKIQKRVLIDL